MPIDSSRVPHRRPRDHEHDKFLLENPPKPGYPVQGFNQMTGTRRVRGLARVIADRTGAHIDHLSNPLGKAVENDRILTLGLTPITLDLDLMEEVTDIARRYAHRRDKYKIPCASLWRQTAPGEDRRIPADSAKATQSA